MLSQKRSPDASGTSQARIEANRLNAQKSTGPTTPRLAGVLSRRAGRPVPEVATEQNKTPSPPFSRRRNDDAETIDHPQSPTESPKPQLILPILPPNQPPSAQNKPNSSKPKINATSFSTKSYERIRPHPDSKKQTQTNPIPVPDKIRHTTLSVTKSRCTSGYDIRNTTPIPKWTNTQNPGIMHLVLIFVFSSSIRRSK
jgi:hypothetical protein